MDTESTDNEPADEDLLRRLSSDPAAFEVFYRRHVDRVIGFAARRVTDPADAADLVAATFVTVLTAARSYDPGRGEPGAWLLGIAARLIVNARRRKARESAALARIAGRRLIGPSDIERLEERIDAARSSQDVIAALERLRPRAREALLLVSEAGLQPAAPVRPDGAALPSPWSPGPRPPGSPPRASPPAEPPSPPSTPPGPPGPPPGERPMGTAPAEALPRPQPARSCTPPRTSSTT